MARSAVLIDASVAQRSGLIRGILEGARLSWAPLRRSPCSGAHIKQHKTTIQRIVMSRRGRRNWGLILADGPRARANAKRHSRGRLQADRTPLNGELKGRHPEVTSGAAKGARTVDLNRTLASWSLNVATGNAAAFQGRLEFDQAWRRGGDSTMLIYLAIQTYPRHQIPDYP
jgi:hypothetical protein